MRCVCRTGRSEGLPPLPRSALRVAGSQRFWEPAASRRNTCPMERTRYACWTSRAEWMTSSYVFIGSRVDKQYAKPCHTPSLGGRHEKGSGEIARVEIRKADSRERGERQLLSRWVVGRGEQESEHLRHCCCNTWMCWQSLSQRAQPISLASCTHVS